MQDKNVKQRNLQYHPWNFQRSSDEHLQLDTTPATMSSPWQLFCCRLDTTSATMSSPWQLFHCRLDTTPATMSSPWQLFRCRLDTTSATMSSPWQLFRCRMDTTPATMCHHHGNSSAADQIQHQLQYVITVATLLLPTRHDTNYNVSSP